MSLTLTSTRSTSRKTVSEYAATVNTRTQSLRLRNVIHVVNATVYPTSSPTISTSPTMLPTLQPSAAPSVTQAPTMATYYQHRSIAFNNFTEGQVTFVGLPSDAPVYVTVEVLNMDTLCGGELVLMAGVDIVYGTLCPTRRYYSCDMTYRTCISEIDVSNHVDESGNLTLTLLAEEDIKCYTCYYEDSVDDVPTIRANIVVTSTHLKHYEPVEPFSYVWEGGYMNGNYHWHTITGLVGVDNLYVTFEVFPTDYDDIYNEYMAFNWNYCYPKVECGSDFYTCHEENVGHDISDAGSYTFTMYFSWAVNYCPYNGYYHYVRVTATSIPPPSAEPSITNPVQVWEGGSNDRYVEHTFNVHTFNASHYSPGDDLFVQVEVYETDFDRDFEYIKLITVGETVLSTFCNPDQECGDRYFVCLRDINVASLIDWDSGNLTFAVEASSTVDICPYNGFTLYSRIALYTQQLSPPTLLPSSTPTTVVGSTLDESWSGQTVAAANSIEHTFNRLESYEHVYLSVDVSYPRYEPGRIRITVNGEVISVCAFSLYCSFAYQACLRTQDMKGLVSADGELTVVLNALTDDGRVIYLCRNGIIGAHVTVRSNASIASPTYYYQQWEGAGPNSNYGIVNAIYTGLTGVYLHFKMTVEIYVPHFGRYDYVNGYCTGSDVTIAPCSHTFHTCASNVPVTRSYDIPDGGELSIWFQHGINGIYKDRECAFNETTPILYRVTLESADPHFAPTSAPSTQLPSAHPTQSLSPTVTFAPTESAVTAEGGINYYEYYEVTLRLVVTNPNVQWQLVIEVFAGDYEQEPGYSYNRKYLYYRILIGGSWFSYYCYPNIGCNDVFFQCTAHDPVNENYINWISPTEGVVEISARSSDHVKACGYNGFTCYVRATLYPVTNTPTSLPSSIPSSTPTSPTYSPSSLPLSLPSISHSPSVSAMPTGEVFVTMEGGLQATSKSFSMSIPRNMNDLYLKVEVYSGYFYYEYIRVTANSEFVGSCYINYIASCLHKFVTCLVDEEVSSMVDWSDPDNGMLEVTVGRYYTYRHCGYEEYDENGHSTGQEVIHARVTLSSVTSPSLIPTAVPSAQPSACPSSAPSIPTSIPSGFPSSVPSISHSPTISAVPTGEIHIQVEGGSATITKTFSLSIPRNLNAIFLNVEVFVNYFPYHEQVQVRMNSTVKGACYPSGTCGDNFMSCIIDYEVSPMVDWSDPDNGMLEVTVERQYLYNSCSKILLDENGNYMIDENGNYVRASIYARLALSSWASPSLIPTAIPSIPSAGPSAPSGALSLQPFGTIIPTTQIDTISEFYCPAYSASYTSSVTNNYVTCPIYACPGNTLTASVCNSCSGDTYLRLYTAAGAQLMSNDDSCGLCSRISMTITASHISQCQYLELRQGCYTTLSCSGQSFVSVRHIETGTHRPTPSPHNVPTPKLSAQPSAFPTSEPSGPTSPPTAVPTPHVPPFSHVNATLHVDLNNTVRYWFPVPVWRCRDGLLPVPARDFLLNYGGEVTTTTWTAEYGVYNESGWSSDT